ncbi:hypothetical protein [Dongia sp.]|uniref:hypothetical protein n=1 Tax=Dongia sp. TaxID=1977262 RepID=UPI0035AE99A2
MRTLLSIGFAAFLALTACSQMPAEPPAAAEDQATYRLGNGAFTFAKGAVLQTWPVIAYQTPLNFARIAVQLPAAELDPALADAGRIQIDVLDPQRRMGDDPIDTLFTDWHGREAAPAGSRYAFDPKSKLQANGGRRTYVRHVADGLVALSPETQDADAPTFFLDLAGSEVEQMIMCRSHVPPSHDVGEFCSLHQLVTEADGGDAYVYRVLFPRAAMAEWPKIDAAARAFLARAYMRGNLSL